jgi:DNA-binding PadR family transcriptional regulator
MEEGNMKKGRKVYYITENGRKEKKEKIYERKNVSR